LDGPSNEIMPLDPLADKFRAFRWNVCPEAYDGHQVTQILQAFSWVEQQRTGPMAVVFRTHKGHGVDFMSDNHKWHGAPVDDRSYANARPQLLSELGRLRGCL
jgi:transketolase